VCSRVSNTKRTGGAALWRPNDIRRETTYFSPENTFQTTRTVLRLRRYVLACDISERIEFISYKRTERIRISSSRPQKKFSNSLSAREKKAQHSDLYSDRVRFTIEPVRHRSFRRTSETVYVVITTRTCCKYKCTAVPKT
jgi:hypothetical protein